MTSAALALVPALETLEDAGVLTPIGLVLPDDLDYDTYERVGWALGQIHRASMWAIGDWLLYGEHGSLDEKVAQAAAASDLSEGTLRYYRWVCFSIARSRRLQSVPFSVHAAVAKLAPQDQKRWLTVARKEKLSQRELKAMIREEEALLSAQQESNGGSGVKSAVRTPDRQTGAGSSSRETPTGRQSGDTTPSGLPLSYLVPGPVVRRLVRDAVPGRDGYVRVPRDLIERLATVLGE